MITKRMRLLFLFYLGVLAMGVHASTRVLMIGDSLLAPNSHVAERVSQNLSITIDNYALIGAGIQQGWVESIPDQYTINMNADYYKVVIMDGGGNDILSIETECRAFSQKCKDTINVVSQKAENLLKMMDRDGVSHVIYVGFYYIRQMDQAIDYGSEQIIKVCKQSTVQCTFCDLRNDSFPLSFDGIHPTEDGYQKIVDIIVKAYQKK